MLQRMHFACKFKNPHAYNLQEAGGKKQEQCNLDLVFFTSENGFSGIGPANTHKKRSGSGLPLP